MDITENFYLKEWSGTGTAAQGVGRSLPLEVFQHRGDVALRDAVSGHGEDELVILEVFSNLNDSMIL